ncbi:PREDICTED: thyrotroph embryonic factor-like [Branchiostoma belcheri]|uniref:Thyrotroph embryonic factor-like n=1 Tax=Branchiostoma belcheri TaxID=7741 RepID=A0A6P4XQY5_BRABE|nr:PREDICTED: thyrotroph embryonic factor-like [Branchiostoma belcheri]
MSHSTENTDRQSTLQALLQSAMLAPPDPGKTDNGDKKKLEDGDEMDPNVMASAFLGPNLWDNVDDFKDFKLEAIDLDAFFAEAGILAPQDIPVGDPSTAGLPETSAPKSPEPVASTSFSQPSPPLEVTSSTFPTSTKGVVSPGVSPPHISMEEVIPEVNYEVSPTDVALASIPGKEEFNPRKRAFSEEELRPQPMIKSRARFFVPEDLKDDKYWERRKKNNVAAKRSRDARRIKENQVALRASFLEKENATLKEELLKAKEENLILSKKLLKYEQQNRV